MADKSVASSYVREARRVRNLLFQVRDWKVTTSIITYELGYMIRQLFYADVYPARAEGHRLQAKSDIIDVITQIEALCQDMVWDFDELRIQGAEKFLERMKQIQAQRAGGDTSKLQSSEPSS